MSFKCLSPGALLNAGRYRVVRELNTGGTAVVYEAFDLRKHRKCALKVMNLSQRQFEVAVKLSEREVFFSSMIHHDNFVKLLDVFSEGERLLVLVWELIPGLDLLDTLNQAGGKMSEPMAAYYFLQLLGGVEFMHDNGFCHRDLKAENCMVVNKTQKLKIIDFGLARQLESAVTSTTGTPDYLAPELLVSSKAERSSIDQRAVDVWAMGVILYLLVSGTYPFEDPDAPECFTQVFKNIRKCNLRPLPGHVSQACRELLHAIFEVNPTKRIQLKELRDNTWLTEQAQIYADDIKPTVKKEKSRIYSVKNLMSRFPKHAKQGSSVNLMLTGKSEPVLHSGYRRGLSMDPDSASGPDFVGGLLYEEEEEMDEDTHRGDPVFGCGLRFVFSKFCVPVPRPKDSFRKRQHRVSPYAEF